MVITDEVIGQRRINYICCALGYLGKYSRGLKFGDKDCGKNRDLWLYMLWAKSVADRVAMTGESCGKCVTDEMASAVFSKADCYCSQCGCPPEDDTIIYPPPPDPCAPTIGETVIAAVDVDERLIIEGDGPVIGDRYFVVSDSGGSGWTVNTIVTWNGSGWDSETPANGTIIDCGGTLWVTYADDEPGLLYPGVTATLVNNTDGLYIIQTEDPQISAYTDRSVRLEILTPGGWIVIPQYAPSIPEADITSPIPFDPGPVSFTAIRATYIDGDCSYDGPIGTIVPPVGECGTLVVEITSERDCDNNDFFVIVDIQQATGYPLGSIVVTLNGSPLAPIDAELGITLLGPYESGDVVNVRITNSFDSECDFDAGDYRDPIIPVADRTAFSAVDASFQGSASPGIPYLIVSDTTGAGNTWAQHVGEYFNGAIFFPLVEGEVVQTTTETGFDKFWQRVAGLTVQMYPPVTLNNTQQYPLPWTVVSDSPFSAATRFRPAVIEGLFDGTWYPIWAGVESQLETPETVDFTAYGLVPPTELRVTYFGTQCPIVVEGSIVNDSIDENLVCDAIDYYTYQYTPNDLNTWLFTSPSGSVDVLFFAGTMDPATVIRAYDGTDNLGTPIPSLTGNFADLTGAVGTGTSGSIFIEIEASPAGSEGQVPWIFGAMCTPAGIRPAAAASPTDDCSNYEFSIDVDVIDAGDSTDGLVNIQYRIIGIAGTTTITGVGLGITTLGPFDYNDQVEILIINTADPLANVLLGTFSSVGTCTIVNDPCIPDGLLKVDYQGDLADLPDPPPNPLISTFYYVLSDDTNIGTFAPGTVVAWNVIDEIWEVSLVVPEGGYIYGGEQTIVGTLGEVTVFGNGPAGPYNAFAPILVSPNPYATSAADAWRIRIDVVADGFVTTDRPVALQVLSNGVWVGVWTGTEQQLGVVNLIEIPVPFTLTRAVYNYDTCAVNTAYVIDPGQGIEQP